MGLLLHLSNTVCQGAPNESVGLWQVKKGDRELRCVTRYLPQTSTFVYLKASTSDVRNSAVTLRLLRHWLKHGAPH